MFKFLELNHWKFIILFSIFCLLFFIPTANAAILYLSPASGSYNLDDTFLVEIRLDTEGEYINVLDVELGFPPEILEVKDFSSGNSVLALWIKEPEINQSVGQFLLSGGIPGGYQGTDGLIGRIIFRAFGTQNGAEIKFQDNSQALLNDGQGTRASLTTEGAIFNISVGAGESKNEWQAEIEEDKILPEPFEIEISQEPAIFDGKYFIIFSTTDKQAGIDHYEVKEGNKKWQRAVSPYVLKNQKLTSDIRVKAIDNAGNYWMEVLKAPNKPGINYLIYSGLGISLVLIAIILWVIKNRSRRSQITSGEAQK